MCSCFRQRTIPEWKDLWVTWGEESEPQRVETRRTESGVSTYSQATYYLYESAKRKAWKDWNGTGCEHWESLPLDQRSLPTATVGFSYAGQTVAEYGLGLSAKQTASNKTSCLYFGSVHFVIFTKNYVPWN